MTQTVWTRLLAVLSACAVFAAPAAAQQAPAGNEHPEIEVLDEAAAALANPFGEPILRPSTTTTLEKHTFAESLDMSPLRGLAVLHGSRVKILDTLARETMRTVNGRAVFTEFVRPRDAEGRVILDAEPEKLRYDPVFTLLDLMIDPAYYLDRPIIHINYLPLRREIVEAQFADQPAAVSPYLRLGRVSPAMFFDHGPEIARRHEFEPAYRDAFNRVDRAIRIPSSAPAMLKMIAPESTEDVWHHVSEWPPEPDVRRAFAELGAAWRALDTDRANSAIRQIAEILPSINSQLYPTGRAELELAYNRANAFEWGMWLYVLSAVLLITAVATGRPRLTLVGGAVLFIAMAMHAVGFTLRCVIAERFAIQNQFESMTGLSLFGALLGAGLMLARRQPLFGAAAAVTGFLVLVTATQTPIPGKNIEREAAILNTSVLLKYHVTTVLVSYGLITIGFVTSLFYLATHYLTKFGAGFKAAEAAGLASNAASPRPTRARVLKDLDSATMVILQLAFWTLGVGTLLGAWWADHSWGRWWAFDPKETWALITWIVYLIVIHVRFGARDKGLVTAWLSVVGFFVMLWTYFGVNLLLPGLHAYA